MTALKGSYTGAGWEDGYAGISAELFFDVDKTNGNVQVPGAEGPITYPRLTNGQVAALATAWKRAAARSSVPTWPDWYPIAIASLGWLARGDRFIMTQEHARAVAPLELIEYFWRSTDRLAKNLDSVQTKRAPLIVDWSYGTYEQAARDAWIQMKAEQGPVNDPRSPAPPVAKGTANDAIWVIVLLIAAYAVGKRRE